MSIFTAEKRGTIERNVTYAVVNDHDLRMDIYYPKSRGPWPALIFIHGGAWSGGDKAPLAIIPSGYLVASINYRLYPQARFPAMIEDVKCAIRFLRAHAAQFNLDPARIGLIGHSAGAHLAALAGLAGPEAGWDVGPYLDQPSSVQAVVELSGPTDLTRTFIDEVDQLKINVFGQDNLSSNSPVNKARRDAPPFMIVHGNCDAVVPVEQAHLLHTALARSGAKTQKMILRNAGHGFEAVHGIVWPPFSWAWARILLFLRRHLRK